MQYYKLSLKSLLQDVLIPLNSPPGNSPPGYCSQRSRQNNPFFQKEQENVYLQMVKNRSISKARTENCLHFWEGTSHSDSPFWKGVMYPSKQKKKRTCAEVINYLNPLYLVMNGLVVSGLTKRALLMCFLVSLPDFGLTYTSNTRNKSGIYGIWPIRNKLLEIIPRLGASIRGIRSVKTPMSGNETNVLSGFQGGLE